MFMAISNYPIRPGLSGDLICFCSPQGAIEVFHAIERFLDPATREALQAWIEKDVFMWRVKAMFGHPPNWRLNMLAGSRPAGGPHDRLDLRYAAAAGL